jgi:hypothetical protein
MEIKRCEYIKTNGQQCGSPALLDEKFCFFHNRWKTDYSVIGEVSLNPIPGTITFPVLEDYESIQMAILQIMHQLTSGHLPTKTGGLLLYGLQIASANLRYADFEPRHRETVVIDPTATHLTPLDGDQWADEDDEDADDEGYEATGDEDEEDFEDGDDEGEEDDEDGEDEEGYERADEEEEADAEEANVGADAPVRPRAKRGSRFDDAEEHFVST